MLFHSATALTPAAARLPSDRVSRSSDVLVLGLPRRHPRRRRGRRRARCAARRLPGAQARRPRPRGAGHGRHRLRRRCASSTRTPCATCGIPAGRDRRGRGQRAARAGPARAPLPWRARRPRTWRGKTVILVDDGLATGSTMRAAALALREGNPARLIGAVPVASRGVCEAMRDVVDEMVCAETPEPFYAVGLWYDDFGQTTDEEVRDHLAAPSSAWPPRRRDQPRADDAGSRRLAAESIAHAALPLRGEPATTTRCWSGSATRAIVLLGEASHGTHEFYRERAEHHAPPDRGARIQRRRRRGRLARRLPRQPLRARRERRPGRRGRARRLPALPALDVAQRRRARVRAVAARRTTTPARRRSRRPASTGSISTASHARSRRSSPISTRSIPRRRRARARATPASTTSATTRRSTATTPRSASAEDCENEVVGQLVELQQRAPRASPAATAARPRTSSSSPSRTRAWPATPRRTTARCSAAASRRGTCATRTWPTRSTRSSHHLRQHDGHARIVVWAHNSHLGDARATEMGVEAS